jgi:hypothetical protein
MNQHLSTEQVSRWIVGERSAAEEQHVRECAECNAEVAQLGSALGTFRGTVLNWSDKQRAAAARPVRTAGRVRHWTGWAMAAAALATAAAIPVYLEVRQQRQVELAKADAALMEQVDAEVSRSIAAPMEPLVKLVAWNDNQNGGEVR